VNRRAFLTSIASGILTPPLATVAQQTGKIARIGILNPGPLPGSPGTGPPRLIPAFTEELRNLGWVDGRTVLIDLRNAAWQLDRLPALAAELVGLGVDALVVMGPAPMVAARAAAGPIPIVMVASSYDAVADGLITSLARPGGNITGLTFAVSHELLAKQLQLLQEVAPGIKRVDWLWDGLPEQYRAHWADVVDASGRLVGLHVVPSFVRTPIDLEAAIRRAPDAVFVAMAGVAYARRADVARIGQEKRRPTHGMFRELPEAGGLMSYGPDLPDLYRRAAGYVDRILKGAKPGDLPVEQPTKFELVINLKTAKALGLTIPPAVLARADEVIQ
jgi:putative ABC transport system substrate-binding protein